MANALVYESENFILEAHEKPHVTRLDGGHLKITPKQRFEDRLDLSPSLAVEMAWLTMISGDAMTTGLRKRGIDIGLINYQDNKNWDALSPEGPHLHVHLYGRAKSATIQKYGEACVFPRRETGFYDGFEPLNDDDIAAIQKELSLLLEQEKYQKSHWHL